MSKGWISVHRDITSHWLYQEKREFSKLEAWLDLLINVNHSEQKVMIKGSLFTVKRGESIMSLETWAKRWNWNKSKVRRFLQMLESDKMVVTKNERITTRLTICNYDSYQDARNADETQTKHKQNADETQMTPNNNDNNVNKENNISNYEEKIDFFINELAKETDYIKGMYQLHKLRPDRLGYLVKHFKSFCLTLPNQSKPKDLNHFRNFFTKWVKQQFDEGKYAHYTTKRLKGSL